MAGDVAIVAAGNLSGTLPTASPKQVGDGFKAVGDGLDATAASLDLAAAAGAFNPSPTGNLKLGIQQLGDQLGQIQTQIDQRAAITDGHIIALYDQMNKSFADLNVALTKSFSDVSATRSTNSRPMSSAVQYTLDRLTQSFSNFESQSLRASNLVPALTVINNWASDPYAYRYTIPGFDLFARRISAPVKPMRPQPALTNAENGNATFNSPVGNTDILGQLDADSAKESQLPHGVRVPSLLSQREQSADSIYVVPESRPFRFAAVCQSQFMGNGLPRNHAGRDNLPRPRTAVYSGHQLRFCHRV